MKLTSEKTIMSSLSPSIQGWRKTIKENANLPMRTRHLKLRPSYWRVSIACAGGQIKTIFSFKYFLSWCDPSTSKTITVLTLSYVDLPWNCFVFKNFMLQKMEDKLSRILLGTVTPRKLIFNLPFSEQVIDYLHFPRSNMIAGNSSSIQIPQSVYHYNQHMAGMT